MIQDIDSRPPSIFLMRLFYYLVVLSLFIALLNHQWELTFLGCTILGMVLTVKVWSRLSLKHVHYDIAVATNRLFPDDTLEIIIRFENAKLLPMWIQLGVNLDSRLELGNKDHYLSKGRWIFPYQCVYLTFRLPVRKRGVYTIGPFDIQGGDLLGFFSSNQSAGKTFQTVVYPRIKPLKTITLPRKDFFGTPGAKHPVEDPIYLLGTRDYQHRRPAKYIHWKASARLNRLQEKLCEPSAQEKVLLTIDVTQFEGRDWADPFEEMLEVAASMVIQLHHRGLAIGLLTNGRTFEDVPGFVPVGYGTKHLTAILEIMARLEVRANGRIEDALTSGIGPTAGVCFAHFSRFRGKEMRQIKAIYTFYKLRGTFFIHRPMDDTEAVDDDLLPNCKYLNEICPSRN